MTTVAPTMSFSVLVPPGAAPPAPPATAAGGKTDRADQAMDPAAYAETEAQLARVTAALTRKKNELKMMRKEQRPDAEAVTRAEGEVTELREEAARLQAMLVDPYADFPKKAFEEMLVRRMFVVPSFEIHTQVAGLFDLGPPACAVKANVVDLWRKHFVVAENMLEMECTNLTPEVVLKTSGHVEKFTDLMVSDVETGECFRADKLLEDAVDALLADPANAGLSAEQQEEHRRVQRQADAFSPEELHAQLNAYNVRAPKSGNALTEPTPFNLMFKTAIGPDGSCVGYLRPETAQGLFVNFKRLLDYNLNRMPFAAAQIGYGFRNEISPRNGLLRVREFCMAEIEHFVNPSDKTHRNFHSVSEEVLTLFSREGQLETGCTTEMTIGQAVRDGVVNNQTLGYFMVRTQMFMVKIGIARHLLRFRQHLESEMAHYSSDCWDLEIRTSHGWIECVGHADRACYDLQVHMDATGTQLLVQEALAQPREAAKIKPEFNKRVMGKTFKRDQNAVYDLIENTLCAGEGPELEARVAAVEAEMQANGSARVENCEGQAFDITSEMVNFQRYTKNVVHDIYQPSVIEPSFGIGRILYALFENAFSRRANDEQRVVMRFNPQVAPVKAHILPLLNQDKFKASTVQIATLFVNAGIAAKVDDSNSTVGRRYSRADEIGVPFGITIDHDTLLDQTVTMRDRDSTEQIRIPVSCLVAEINALVAGTKDWDDMRSIYPLFRAADDEDGLALDGSAESKANDQGDGDRKPAPQATCATVVEKTSRGKFSRPAEPLI